MFAKKFILTIIMILVIGINVPAAQTPIVIKVATKMPPTSPEGIAFAKFGELINTLGQGRIKAEVYPSEMLGGTDATLEQLRSGIIDVYPEGGSYLQRYVDEFKVVALPFVYRDREHWKKFLSSDVVKEWHKKLQEKNIRILGNEADFVRGPYRVLVSKKPVSSVSDLKGLRIRMFPDDTVIAVWKELGTVTIMLEWTAIYEGIARGIVEACTSPMALVESMKFYEVAKYIIRTDEFPQGIAFMMNNKKFESLPQDLQKVVLDAHKGSCELSAQLMSKAAEESLKKMIEKHGVKYSTPDMTPFREKVRPLYIKWEKEGKLPKGILEYIESIK